jgi:hypothetical protein
LKLAHSSEKRAAEKILRRPGGGKTTFLTKAIFETTDFEISSTNTP